MNPAVDLFLFDMAGTTIHDDGFVLGAFLAAAESADLHPDPEWVRARMGLKKLAVFESMLLDAQRDPADAPALNAEFERQIAHQCHVSPPRALPGAADALGSLAHAGVKIGFTTGFSQSTARPLLAALGWSEALLAASDMVPHGRPHPDLIHLAMSRAGVADPRRVGIAGDTPSDLQAGHAARCAFVVGVGHGSHTLAELEPHPHTHLLPDLTDLPKVLHVLP